MATTILERLGNTFLTQVGNKLFLNTPAGGTGPSLKLSGADVLVGAVIVGLGAEAVTGGYDVALMNATQGTYNVFSTDTLGNITGSLTGGYVSAIDWTLQNLETTLLQDLNGDGTTGLVSTKLETSGVTALTQVSNKYYLNPTIIIGIGGGAAPTLKLNGADVTVGQIAGMAPIGAELTATGYLVAWKSNSAEVYNIFTTDSNGNITGSATNGKVPGNIYNFESLETSLQQDLNGDHTVGLLTIGIESNGLTRLDQIANRYYLTTGVTVLDLKLGGLPLIAANLPAGTVAIAAEVNAAGPGYYVVWKNSAQGTYNIWLTDSNGDNPVSITNGYIAGTASALQTAEVTLQQDLNGDHFIGLATTVIESLGVTALAQLGNKYYLNPIAGGTGPTLKVAGIDVAPGQIGDFNPIGAETIAGGGGYYVAWKQAGQDVYTIWTTDTTGNAFGSVTNGIAHGNDLVVENLETSFHQDLNGDGTIGKVSTIIESSGATALTQVANVYFLNTVAGATGPKLQFNGANVTVGQFGGAAVIGAEAVNGGGYDVVFRNSTNDLFNVWSTDGTGNLATSLTNGYVAGSSATLQGFETVMHQDFNGDGIIGAAGNIIDHAGATFLTLSNNNYFLNTSTGGIGPTIKLSGGVTMLADLYPAVTPIGAEAVTGGFNVAWKVVGAYAYIIWATDVNGNVTANLTNGSSLSGVSTAIQNAETIFHQDLNGDGVTGLKTTILDSFGATALTQVANKFFLNPVAGGTGPTIKLSGIDLAVIQIPSGVSLVGAEADTSGGGYYVAWKNSSNGTYNIWSTDANGDNATSATGGYVPGSNITLKTYEALLHQDINGDGVIGLPAFIMENTGVTALAQVGNTYLLNPVAGGVGPTLKFGGADVFLGEFGTTAVVAVEKVTGGYDIAFSVPGSDQYSVWSADAKGNLTAPLTNGLVHGSDATFQALETTFFQDLNGDGVTGVWH